VQAQAQSARDLARHLRALREEHWYDVKVTQQQIAEAFGGDKPLSESLISSWESVRRPVAPPLNRLRAYATFFATRRSLEGGRPHLLTEAELTAGELAERDRLHEELLQLWNSERSPGTAEVSRMPLAVSVDQIGGGSWYFADQRPVTIICAELPPDMRDTMPYTNSRDPDYVRSYGYADLDSLIELHGHIRATNPTVEVHIRTPEDMEEDDYTAHLVVLGGVDWNPVTRDIFRRLKLPIRQVARQGETVYSGHFEVNGTEGPRVFAPNLEDRSDRPVLREDVAMIYRGPSPYNHKRTVTLCNGMFGRGTYGVVRALTDLRFRDRNEEYLADRFSGEEFGILTRVLIVNREALTPDWTQPANRLFEWPSA
jgi:transcriptional regulator with XRE-family HTH domain